MSVSKDSVLMAIDAWTYLNIESGNPWGIKASMYSSNEMLRGK